MFELALKLGKSIAEIERMPVDDLAEWLAFFSVKKQEDDDAALRARADQAAQAGRAERVRAYKTK